MADTTKRMDRAEIAKRVERAEKLLQKGKTADALQEYMQALADVTKQGKQAECLTVLKRLVGLDPSERNFLRVGELSSELQDNKGAAAAFLKLAQLTETSGASAAQWYERAYNGDSSDLEIALGYGKSLMA